MHPVLEGSASSRHIAALILPYTYLDTVVNINLVFGRGYIHVVLPQPWCDDPLPPEMDRLEVNRLLGFELIARHIDREDITIKYIMRTYGFGMPEARQRRAGSVRNIDPQRPMSPEEFDPNTGMWHSASFPFGFFSRPSIARRHGESHQDYLDQMASRIQARQVQRPEREPQCVDAHETRPRAPATTAEARQLQARRLLFRSRSHDSVDKRRNSNDMDPIVTPMNQSGSIRIGEPWDWVTGLDLSGPLPGSLAFQQGLSKSPKIPVSAIPDGTLPKMPFNSVTHPRTYMVIYKAMRDRLRERSDFLEKLQVSHDCSTVDSTWPEGVFLDHQLSEAITLTISKTRAKIASGDIREDINDFLEEIEFLHAAARTGHAVLSRQTYEKNVTEEDPCLESDVQSLLIGMVAPLADLLKLSNGDERADD